MKRFSYGERDYAFGQAMLTLRTSVGLTQAGLADLLGVSRRAVGEWEAGSSYPKAEHLKHLIELAVKQQAFPTGQEAEEIRALWQAARQKVLLDEQWLATLLNQRDPAWGQVIPHLRWGRLKRPMALKCSALLLLLRLARRWHHSQNVPRCRSEKEPFPLATHGWIGVTRWMCRASMGAKENWPPLPSGWCRSTAGW
jgi:transcriptional regulator with XRE-family HTH domain